MSCDAIRNPRWRTETRVAFIMPLCLPVTKSLWARERSLLEALPLSLWPADAAGGQHLPDLVICSEQPGRASIPNQKSCPSRSHGDGQDELDAHVKLGRCLI